MRLKFLKLENIRSYSGIELNFPSGSLLLSGEIGSGKSTVLLSIEFALFGLKPGELTGNPLLRFGQARGSVELALEMDGREIVIKRTLKRGAKGISQAAGQIIIAGSILELMPQEMNARIYEMLNYPMILRGKDLIYRYTVYTPQEEMKKIIYENKDLRLDTLRKVFNIDKYKRIRENALSYAKELKIKRSKLEGQILDLDGKKNSFMAMQKDMDELSGKQKEANKRLETARKITVESKANMAKFEARIREIDGIKKDLAVCSLELSSNIKSREDNIREIKKLNDEILKLREELANFIELPDIHIILEDKERRINTLDKEIVQLATRKAEIRGKANHLNEQAGNVSKIENCPLCQQSVSHNHKQSIKDKAAKETMELMAQLESLAAEEKSMASNLGALKAEEKELMAKSVLQGALKEKKIRQIGKEERMHMLKERTEELMKKIVSLNSNKIVLSQKILEGEKTSQMYDESKKGYEESLLKERKVELEKNSLDKEIEGLGRQLLALDEEIRAKERNREELIGITELQNWIEGKFANLVASIEKHVMMTVYAEFNEHLQRWFNLLIEDENMSIRLDDDFTVIVEQNGYESSIENLSGGERTSVALAYRLALNKVINDVVSEIRTKDLLILDEPTEGFSSSQLDRLREVLVQLEIGQIIIVSHESKIESFVDSVIRISKEEGVSSIS